VNKDVDSVRLRRVDMNVTTCSGIALKVYIFSGK